MSALHRRLPGYIFDFPSSHLGVDLHTEDFYNSLGRKMISVKEMFIIGQQSYGSPEPSDF